jgi:hypothetical protein
MCNEYYVYMYLREDGTPYYVGKGKKNRAYTTHKRVKPPSNDRIVFPYTDLTEEDAFKYEKDLIAKYGRKDNNTGILRNLTDGGEGMSGYKGTRTPEHSEKISKALKGRIGHKHSPETIEKISKALKGRIGYKQSPDHRENLCKALRSPETKEKMRLAKIGKKQSPKHIEKRRLSRINNNPSNILSIIV